MKVNDSDIKGLTKICLFASPVNLLPKAFFFFFNLLEKKIIFFKALTSTLRFLNGLSAHFSVTDFLRTNDFSGRRKHSDVQTQRSKRSRWEYSFHNRRLLNTQASWLRLWSLFRGGRKKKKVSDVPWYLMRSPSLPEGKWVTAGWGVRLRFPTSLTIG